MLKETVMKDVVNNPDVDMADIATGIHNSKL